jgi:outer membrane protein assembly factor BamB
VNGKIYCRDASLGTEIWTKDYWASGAIVTTPAVSNNKIYFVANDDTFCLDFTTGNQLWTYHNPAGIYSSPAVYNGKIYYGTLTIPGFAEGARVICLNANTGLPVWSYSIPDTEIGAYGIPGSPAVAGGKVYIGWDGDNTNENFYCFDANTGSILGEYMTVSTIWGSPAIADGKVYVGDWSGNMYCFE